MLNRTGNMGGGNCVIRLETTFAGSPVRLWRPKYQRHLEWIGGVVARAAPVLLLYRGRRRRALKEAARLKRYGYRVTVRRERKPE